MTRHLTDCTTAVERLEWVRHRLSIGHTVTEVGLSMGGVVSPAALIAGLRATGTQIETITVSRVDTSGKKHTGCMAWRLMLSPIGREATRAGSRLDNATIKHPTVPEHGKVA